MAEYQLEFIEKENREEMRLPCKLSKGNSFDGVIFIGRFHQGYANFLKQSIGRQIFYTGYSPSYDCDSVWFNFNNGGCKQYEYLINRGHKNIGFIGKKPAMTGNLRGISGGKTNHPEFFQKT